MKKLLIMAMAAGTAAISASGQKLKESQVPVAARNAFEKKYPGTKGNWDREDANYEVNFRQQGKSMSAVIDKNGTIVETETDIAISDLPAPVQPFIKGHYPNAKITEAAKIVKENGDVNYEAEVNHKDLVFDANGKFVKETED